MLIVRQLLGVRMPSDFVHRCITHFRGGSSDVVSAEGVQDFLNLLPTAKFIDVADAGHMVAGDKNDIFTDAVVDFLGQTFTDHETA